MAMEKSPDAFRTISEVADRLGVPAHVLRFWESRFPQVKPVKRAGGRRYYRRADVALLDGIRKLLHDDGMTIRAVQSLLREKGLRTVADLGRELDEVGDADGAVESRVLHAPVDEAPEDAAAFEDIAEPPETAGSGAPQGVTEEPADLAVAGAETLEDPADSGTDTSVAVAEPLAASGAESRETPAEQAALDPVPEASVPEAAGVEDQPVAVPEAPMAQDVPVVDEPQVLRFVRSAPAARPVPTPPRVATQPELDLGPVDSPPVEPAAVPAAPEPAPSLAVEVPDDPADDDSAWVRAPRSGFSALDPAVAGPLRDRLAAIRRRLGDPPQRLPG